MRKFLKRQILFTFFLKLYYLIKKMLLNIQILFKLIIIPEICFYSMSKTNFYKLDFASRQILLDRHFCLLNAVIQQEVWIGNFLLVEFQTQ